LALPGSTCVVVEQADPSAAGAVVLRVARVPQAGEPVSSTLQGSTCGAVDDSSPASACSTGSGEDVAYFTLACPPQEISASACSTTLPVDTVLYLRRWSPAAPDLACSDDVCAGQASIDPVAVSEPGLYWLVVDGKGGCGEFDVAVTVGP
jgi:hypothetical protein